MHKWKLNNQEYVDADGAACPHCGSFEIVGDEITIGNGEASQEVSCSLCMAEWEDHYLLTGYKQVATPLTNEEELLRRIQVEASMIAELAHQLHQLRRKDDAIGPDM